MVAFVVEAVAELVVDPDDELPSEVVPASAVLLASSVGAPLWAELSDSDAPLWLVVVSACAVLAAVVLDDAVVLDEDAVVLDEDAVVLDEDVRLSVIDVAM